MSIAQQQPFFFLAAFVSVALWSPPAEIEMAWDPWAPPIDMGMSKPPDDDAA